MGEGDWGGGGAALMVDVGIFPFKYIRKYIIVQEDLSRAVSRVLYAIKSILSRKLKSLYGARNLFQEPSMELSSRKLHRLAGQYDKPMFTSIWFLAPIAGLKLLTLFVVSDKTTTFGSRLLILIAINVI